MHAIYERHMGDDHAVANAARVSFDKLAEMFTPAENDSLIRFLARGLATKDWDKLCLEIVGCDNVIAAAELANHIKRIPEHWVPFAHTALTLRMAAPVPIRTQAFKHKQGLVESEESRRYIKSRPVLFIPEHFRAAPEGSVKQGSGGVHPCSDAIRTVYIAKCNEMIDLYECMVEDGVAPEQARFALPQGVEVHWIWTGNLYAFANFYNKRSDLHAQGEIQDLAAQVQRIIAPLFPVSWAALTGV